MAENLRASDHEQEGIISQFLDEHLYVKRMFSQVKRADDRESQLKGVDVEFLLDGKHVFLDEKAQVHYINQDLPTFAFEINFLHKGRVIDGWLFDKEKKTTHYLLVWVRAEGGRLRKVEDIRRLECLMVSREEIILFLLTNGLDSSGLEKTAEKIRAEETYGAYGKDDGKDWYWFYSPQLAEKPINIVIKKRALEAIAARRFIIP